MLAVFPLSRTLHTMPHRAVLFDLDGTLLDTLEDLADSTNAALAALGFPTRPVDEYRVLVGDGLRNLLVRALPEGHRDEQTVERCARLRSAEYDRRWDAKTCPYPGVPELLDALALRKVPMAILSNKPDAATRKIVARLLPSWTFGAVLGAREGVPLKPDPCAALQAAEALSVRPGEVLYLGDTNTDMRTARAAGMRAVGALWGFRTAEELLASGAEDLIERPQDLLALLA
jgi:phosphoglycolate phosphatase